jgi:hypothetical protein
MTTWWKDLVFQPSEKDPIMPEKKTNLVHSFHVVLADGGERDVTGTDARIVDGGLEIRNTDRVGELVLYAPNAWTLCELERQDDRG